LGGPTNGTKTLWNPRNEVRFRGKKIRTVDQECFTAERWKDSDQRGERKMMAQTVHRRMNETAGVEKVLKGAGNTGKEAGPGEPLMEKARAMGEKEGGVAKK